MTLNVAPITPRPPFVTVSIDGKPIDGFLTDDGFRILQSIRAKIEGETGSGVLPQDELEAFTAAASTFGPPEQTPEALPCSCAGRVAELERKIEELQLTLTLRWGVMARVDEQLSEIEARAFL